MKSLIDTGLLLTPERIEFAERLADGTHGDVATIYQKRICFTELAEAELEQHSELFGPFALEWEQSELRKLGAIPVFYVPIKGPLGSAETAAASILSRLGEVQTILERLVKLKNISSSSNSQEPIHIDLADGQVSHYLFGTSEGKRLISCLEYGNQPIEDLLSSLRATFGYFYPTDDVKYGDLLDYYRQREWRIVGNMMLDGVAMTSRLSGHELDAINSIDPDFFERKLTYPTGEYSLAEQTLKFDRFGGRHVLETCRRIIVPSSVEQQVRQLIENSRVSLLVSTL